MLVKQTFGCDMIDVTKTLLKHELTDGVDDNDEPGMELGAVVGVSDGQMCRAGGGFD